MNNSELRAKIIAALKSVRADINEAVLSDDMDLREGLDIDSVDMMRYVSQLEETLNIRVSGEYFSDFRTIAGAISRLQLTLEKTNT